MAYGVYYQVPSAYDDPNLAIIPNNFENGEVGVAFFYTCDHSTIYRAKDAGVQPTGSTAIIIRKRVITNTVINIFNSHICILKTGTTYNENDQRKYGNLKFKLAWKVTNQRHMFEIRPVNASLPVTYPGDVRESHSFPRILSEITETIQATRCCWKTV